MSALWSCDGLTGLHVHHLTSGGMSAWSWIRGIGKQYNWHWENSKALCWRNNKGFWEEQVSKASTGIFRHWKGPLEKGVLNSPCEILWGRIRLNHKSNSQVTFLHRFWPCRMAPGSICMQFLLLEHFPWLTLTLLLSNSYNFISQSRDHP